MIGNWDKAIACCSKAIELDPKVVSPWVHRGRAHIGLRQWDKAIADYGHAIDLEPKNAGNHNDLAWLLATQADPQVRDPRRAVELAQKAVKLAPKVGDYWNTLGMAQFRAMDLPAALAALEKSMELTKGGGSADWCILAMVHWQLDHKEEARKFYHRAVQWMEANQPNNDELRGFRAEAAKLLGITDQPKEKK